MTVKTVECKQGDKDVQAIFFSKFICNLQINLLLYLNNFIQWTVN